MTRRADTLGTSDRLGFISPAGAVIAGVVLAGVVAWTLVGGPVLFDPGPLNAVSKSQTLGGVTSHAQVTGCEACHSAPWSSQTMAGRCMVCHADVGAQVATRQGLHGRFAGGPSSPTCRGCHVEHRGPAGALTVTDANFPHALTGYSLRGHRNSAKGAKVTCAACHPKGLATFDPASCATCHSSLDAAFMSQHVASFGAQCLTCHDGSGRYGFDFDHSKLRFKLTGRHASLACQRCHPNAQGTTGFQNTPQDCYGCHAKNDKHQGAFGRQCGQCHTPAGWAGATFDHTIFPVDHGREQQAATCKTCHPNDVSTYTCFGCHEHTPANIPPRHEGRSLAELADCIRCHQGGRGGGD